MIAHLSNTSLFFERNNEKTALKLTLSALFLALILGYSLFFGEAIFHSPSLLIALLFGGYMALTIGANDVANVMGPTVGCKALSMPAAIILAVLFELAGALLAGADVVSTIRKDIVDTSVFIDQQRFIWVMLAALAAAAAWITLATSSKAPVSTTQSIVGGIVGAAIAAHNVSVVNWSQLITISAAWLTSPLIGGLLAIGLLFLVEKTIIKKADPVAAAIRWLPIYLALIVGGFSFYITTKLSAQNWVGITDFISQTMNISIAAKQEHASTIVFLIALLIAVAAFIAVKKLLSVKRYNITETNSLFNIPLVIAAIMMSFAHGANDVANVVGPVTAIYEVIAAGNIEKYSNVPFEILVLGGVGIAVGLTLFGARMIRVVGTEITRLDQKAAFAIVFAVAITVIAASQCGMPVSSTYIALGGVFALGLVREAKNHQKTKLVQRSLMKQVITAWLITVPCTAVFAAMFFYIADYIF